MTTLKLGTPAPDFTVQTVSGEVFTLGGVTALEHPLLVSRALRS